MGAKKNTTSTGQPAKYSDDVASLFIGTVITPDGTLNVSGGISATGPISGTGLSGNVVTLVAGQSPYTVLSTDETIVCDCTAGAITVNLPAAVAGNIGRILYIAKKDSSANAVTIVPSGTDTINGVNTGVVLGLQFEVANIQVTAAGAWLSIMGDVVIRTVQAIDGVAGSNRDLDWTTAGLLRWQLRANGTAEGGANAGSDLNLNAYSDTGVLLGTYMSVIRSTGAVSFGANALTVGAITSSGIVANVGAGNSMQGGAFISNVTSTGLTLFGVNSFNSGFYTVASGGFQLVSALTGTGVSTNTLLLSNGTVFAQGLLTAQAGLTVSAGTITFNLGGGTGIVTAGAADSAGVGFRFLKVPN